jgi:hypothetical protein
VVRGNIAYTGCRSARRLTPFRSSTAPSFSRKRVSRTTREPLRPSKSAAARPLYELHVKPSWHNPGNSSFTSTRPLHPISVLNEIYITICREEQRSSLPRGLQAGDKMYGMWHILYRSLFEHHVPFQTLPHCCDKAFVSGVHTHD